MGASPFIIYKWVKDNKYYKTIVHKNIFGKWTISKHWGSTITKHGYYKSAYFDELDDALDDFYSTKKRRQAHKYKLVSSVMV